MTDRISLAAAEDGSVNILGTSAPENSAAGERLRSIITHFEDLQDAAATANALAPKKTVSHSARIRALPSYLTSSAQIGPNLSAAAAAPLPEIKFLLLIAIVFSLEHNP
jgi:hypothetical protein